MKNVLLILLSCLSIQILANAYTPYSIEEAWNAANDVVRGTIINKDSTDDKAHLIISNVVKGNLQKYDTIQVSCHETIRISCVAPVTYKDGEEVIGFYNTKNNTLFHSVHAGSGIKKATAYDLGFI